jgi:hypothetical protein
VVGPAQLIDLSLQLPDALIIWRNPDRGK